MYQNLALSPLFFEGLKDINDLAYSKLLSNLLTERIICDDSKTILQEYDEKLTSLDQDNNISPIKKAIIQTLTLSGNINFKKDVRLNKRNDRQLKDYDSEKKLVADEISKLIISNHTTPELKLKLKLETDIEIAGLSEYSKPPDNSRIRREENIKKIPGETFNFRNWIIKYIRDAKKMTIRDGYLCTSYSLPDFRFILKSIDNKIPIEVCTLSDKERNKSRDPKNPKSDGLNVHKTLNELMQQFSLESFSYNIIDNKSQLTERLIDTDLWHINLGHALGSVDGVNVKREFEINVMTKEF